MQDLNKKLDTLGEEFKKAYDKLAIADKLEQIAKLEQQVANPDIWKNVEEATAKNQELAKLQDETNDWELLKTQIQDLKELIDISDTDLKPEIERQIESMDTNLKQLKKSLRFQGPYDKSDAIIRITSGAGGTEAMDWASMLERMYLRFFEKNNYKVARLERTEGEEAGIKTAVYEISGSYPYGNLKSCMETL